MDKLRLWYNSNDEKKLKKKRGPPVIDGMVSGFGAGFVATALGFPLDLIKTRMQTSNQTSQKEGSSIFKTGRGIVRNEGIGGLYKGLASPLLTLSVQGMISFSTFGAFKELYRAEQGWSIGNWMAGLSCGPIVGVISTVELHVRTQMQLDNIEKQKFRNSIHCAKNIVKNHGITTLFSGWGVTTMKDSLYYSTYFLVYEGGKETLKQSDIPIISKASIPIAGGAAGTAAWLLSYPFDSIRAGLHTQTLKRGATPTAVEVSQDLVKSQGIRGLFMGITPTLVRASMVHSVRFSVYETFLWLFRTYRDDEMEGTSKDYNKSEGSIFGFLKKEKIN